MKTKLSSSVVWEDIVGYSRAIKVGNLIEIAGTAAVKTERLYILMTPTSNPFILSK